MKQKHVVGALCFMCVALSSSSGWASETATVDPSHGVVLINRGKGFNQIKRPVKVKVGNSVMVGPGGSAVIAYNDGCTVKVEPGTVKTVASLSPCASDSSAAADPSYSQTVNGNYVFWGIFGGTGAFIGYEISQISP